MAADKIAAVGIVAHRKRFGLQHFETAVHTFAQIIAEGFAVFAGAWIAGFYFVVLGRQKRPVIGGFDAV